MKRQVFWGEGIGRHILKILGSTQQMNCLFFLNVKTYTFFKKISAVDRCKYKPKEKREIFLEYRQKLVVFILLHTLGLLF